jgi:hypothetical protein
MATNPRSDRPNTGKPRTAKRGTSSRRPSPVRPATKRRAKPGASGKGEFFHIEVRPKSEFKTFRNQDVGEPGGIERIAGKRSSGSWDTQKWLIGKDQAHINGDRLIADTADARKVLRTLGSEPLHLGGDRFRAKDRANVPEADKPTPAQKRRARSTNIRKALAARRQSRSA